MCCLHDDHFVEAYADTEACDDFAQGGKMSEELRECPFCGGEDVEHLPDGFGNWLVGCVTCDYRIQCVSCTEDEAIRKWNNRPAENALKADVERLKSKLALVKEHLVVHRESALNNIWEDKDQCRKVQNEFMAWFCNRLIELINTDTVESKR